MWRTATGWFTPHCASERVFHLPSLPVRPVQPQRPALCCAINEKIHKDSLVSDCPFTLRCQEYLKIKIKWSPISISGSFLVLLFKIILTSQLCGGRMSSMYCNTWTANYKYFLSNLKTLLQILYKQHKHMHTLSMTNAHTLVWNLTHSWTDPATLWGYVHSLCLGWKLEYLSHDVKAILHKFLTLKLCALTCVGGTLTFVTHIPVAVMAWGRKKHNSQLCVWARSVTLPQHSALRHRITCQQLHI